MEKDIKIGKIGFVSLVDVMGNDDAIADAARISYKKGTKKISDNIGLIRYLVRNSHTSPLEMGVLRFHLKLPIFVMRQLVRHRTASLNEQSGRYSEMSDEFYLPELEDIKEQSKTNKQGTGDDLDFEKKATVSNIIENSHKSSYQDYKDILDNGVARELSRIVLPVSNFTECVWQINLHNFMHFLKLRLDHHAQKEIRDYAQAMYELAKPHFPICFDAFNDYVVNSIRLSELDIKVIAKMLDVSKLNSSGFEEIFKNSREKQEFLEKLDKISSFTK